MPHAKAHSAHKTPHSHTDGLRPLKDVKCGQEVALVRVEGGRAFQHRLAEMGLVPGVRFRVTARGKTGPFIVSVKHTRLVLGEATVDRVLVRPA